MRLDYLLSNQTHFISSYIGSKYFTTILLGVVIMLLLMILVILISWWVAFSFFSFYPLLILNILVFQLFLWDIVFIYLQLFLLFYWNVCWWYYIIIFYHRHIAVIVITAPSIHMLFSAGLSGIAFMVIVAGKDKCSFFLSAAMMIIGNLSLSWPTSNAFPQEYIG